MVASEVVEEGCEWVPTPSNLISLLEQAEEESVSWTSSTTESSGSSLEIYQEDFEPSNLIELGDEHRRKYILPEAKWKYHKRIERVPRICSFFYINLSIFKMTYLLLHLPLKVLLR